MKIRCLVNIFTIITLTAVLFFGCTSSPLSNATKTPEAAGMKISGQPIGARYGAGSAIAPLTVEAAIIEDGSVPSCQWFSSGVKSIDGGTPVSGATGASFTPSITSPGTYYYYAKLSAGTGEDAPFAYTDIAAVTVYSFPINEMLLLWDDEPVYLAADWQSLDAPSVLTTVDEGSAGNYRSVITLKKTGGPGQVWAANYTFPEPKNFDSLTNPTDADPADKDRATTGYFHMMIYIEKSDGLLNSSIELYTAVPELVGGVSHHAIKIFPYAARATGRWYEINIPLSDLEVTNGFDPETGHSSKDGKGDWSSVSLMRFWFVEADGSSLNSVQFKDVFIYR